jgi:hypothetical protein
MRLNLTKPPRTVAKTGLFALIIAASCQAFAIAHEWTDSTGSYKVSGTLIAMDSAEIVIKLDKSTKGQELLAFPIEKLSEADRKYIDSDEVLQKLSGDGEKHTWKLKNGITVFGKVVDFARKDVTIQRRRGKVYVNDRPLENLPEIYRRMVPHIVEYFENKKFKDDKEFMAWVVQLKADPKTFHCEGVLLELNNGDEYAFPFFVFDDKDLQTLKPSWDKWAAAQGAAEEKQEQQRQNSLYLQSQAAAYQQQQAEQMQIARLQLQLTAVNAGLIDMWEVYLYPPAGVPAYPMTVIVSATNSSIASQIAMQNNPGYLVGPIRKVAGR